jgi:hypothetical protein
MAAGRTLFNGILSGPGLQIGPKPVHNRLVMDRSSPSERCRTMQGFRTNIYAAMLAAAAAGSAATFVGLAMAYQPMLQLAYGAGWQDGIMSGNVLGLNGVEVSEAESGVRVQAPTAQLEPQVASADNC